MAKYNLDCSYFTGYKPCKFKRPCDGCPTYSPVATRIAIISLEAMGAVLRSTCLLEPLKKKFENAHITWITLPVSKPLLENNPFIDRLVALTPQSSFALKEMKFDALYSVDKSFEAGALAKAMTAKRKLGFGIDKNGVIVPLNSEAQYQYDLGLDDELKFFTNEKPEIQQITETMDLDWDRAPYVLQLTEAEEQKRQNLKSNIQGNSEGIIGINSGCSKLFPYKKLTVSDSIRLIKKIRTAQPNYKVALLGGPEDTDRQAEIKNAFEKDEDVVNTATNSGLRNGMILMGVSDVVFSGDSLGMHIAIGLKIPTVAWFGLSCAQEIDLYDRGTKLQAKVGCSPCWKKSCSQIPKCYEKVDLDEAVTAISSYLT